MNLLGYVPFVQPLPGSWHSGVWPFLMLPLCLAVSVVYKSIKCDSMRQVPRQAIVLTAWIILGMVSAAVALGLLVRGVEVWRG